MSKRQKVTTLNRNRKPQRRQPSMKQPINKQMNINVSNLKPEACECGSMFFVSAQMIIKVPSVVSPTGKEEITRLGVSLCMACNAPFIENPEVANLLDRGKGADDYKAGDGPGDGDDAGRVGRDVEGDTVPDVVDITDTVVPEIDLECECGRKVLSTFQRPLKGQVANAAYGGTCICGKVVTKPVRVSWKCPRCDLLVSDVVYRDAIDGLKCPLCEETARKQETVVGSSNLSIPKFSEFVPIVIDVSETGTDESTETGS